MPENTYTINPTLNKNKIFLLQKSEVEKRLDPQFYKQEFKYNIAKIKKVKHKRLGEVVKYSTETWNQKDFFNSTFPYIEISEIDTLSGEIQNISQVEIKNAPSRAKMVVRENDIIISTTRPNRGAISFIRKQNDFSIASTVFSVIRDIINPEIKREYLFAVIRQHIILKQFEQRSSGGNYPAITPEELNNVIIPIPEINKQEKIISIFKTCVEQKKQNEAQTEKLLASIDDYLLKELGITLPTPPENILMNRIFTTTIKEISGGRFDPKLYSPQTKALLKSLLKTKYEFQTLKVMIVHSTAGDWGLDENEKVNENEYVKCLVLRATEFDNKFNLNVEGNRAKYRLINKIKLTTLDIQTDDLLIEKSGGSRDQPVGRIAILHKDLTNNYTLCFSNFVHKIRFNQNIIYPEFAFNYLKTIHNIKITDVMQSQTNGIRNLILSEYFNLPIPIPSLTKQKEIAKHITDIRKQAQQLKDKTKEALEKAGKEIESILLS
ncbi:MAG: hypothetical protein GW805_10440 [Ignavibacteria bacterium]|nr:hypothetical protein [Ignavibacteria bacterium]